MHPLGDATDLVGADVTKKQERLELVHGSGNVFRDFGNPNPDVEQMKAVLAAQVVLALDGRKLTVRAAQELTGVTAADFSRIRRVKLDRFTIDRLVTILNKLDRRVDVNVTIAPRRRVQASPQLAVR